MNHLIREAAAALALSMSALLSLAPTSANAVVWISQLEYKSSAPGAKVTPFGYARLEDGLLSGTQVKIDVFLNANFTLFLDTGNNTTQQPFSFNLLKDPAIASDPNGTVAVQIPVSGRIIPDAAAGPFHQDAFGFFTNALACPTCNGANGVAPPLEFTVTNAKGLTFAGVGSTVDASGALQAATAQHPVTGNRFASNSDGWWFAADVYQSGSCGNACTFVVGARDAVQQRMPGVPEPSSWALMILGFGTIGAMLRRERRLRHSGSKLGAGVVSSK